MIVEKGKINIITTILKTGKDKEIKWKINVQVLCSTVNILTKTLETLLLSRPKITTTNNINSSHTTHLIFTWVTKSRKLLMYFNMACVQIHSRSYSELTYKHHEIFSEENSHSKHKPTYQRRKKETPELGSPLSNSGLFLH